MHVRILQPGHAWGRRRSGKLRYRFHLAIPCRKARGRYSVRSAGDD